MIGLNAIALESGEQALRLHGVSEDPIMVRWYHVIMTAYGFWLPNDPRGSWSDFVGAWELRKFGPATKVSGGRSRAHDPHDSALRRTAKQALKYPPVRFDAHQRACVAEGFAVAVAEGAYIVHACCIGCDHAHLVIARHDRTIERIAGHLKSKATMALTRQDCHPLRDCRKTDGTVPTPWSEYIWSVYINDEGQLHSAIRYVERHPTKEGLPHIDYPFLTPIPT